ncbi:MAG TPA: hypothetical protein VM422_11050 [Amaricoccus sp.]|nr:hypothetical protein [Amaricoccus sp.]
MAARRGGGFWRGFLVGAVIAVAGTLALAVAFPPLRPPDVDAASLVAPGGPLEPRTAAPPAATRENRLPERSGPPAAPELGRAPDAAP